VEVVLPGGVKTYKKATEPDTALEANTAQTYMFVLPSLARSSGSSDNGLEPRVAG
jgi:hypothetical protein